MKIDVCEQTRTTKEICSKIKYCCDMMEAANNQHIVDIDIKDNDWSPHYKIRLDTDLAGHFYNETAKIRIRYTERIYWCPWCGEQLQ